MVGVEVGDEDLVQVDEADRGAEQLPLRALAAVEEQPVAPAADQERARRAARGGSAPGGAEEDDVEVLRQHEDLARMDARAHEVVRGLDLPDGFAYVAAVALRRDRPERVVGLHTVDRLVPVGARRPRDDAPDEEGETGEDEHASEHVFVE